MGRLASQPSSVFLFFAFLLDVCDVPTTAIVRWNPEQENELFLIQAATIGGFYYLHQIAVHRSFMTRPSSSRRESPISPLSTIICVNAARAAIQVVEVVYNRTGNPTHGNMVRPSPPSHDEIR